jgi:hypothetical protein
LRAACFFLATALVIAQDQNGGITGVVTDAITDPAGAFAISGLSPGKYRLSVTHRSYPQTPGNRTGQQTIEVMAGAIKGPVTVELMPGASVTGHILDEDGDPLTGCMVSLRNFSNPNQYAGQTQSPFQEDGESRARSPAIEPSSPGFAIESVGFARPEPLCSEWLGNRLRTG